MGLQALPPESIQWNWKTVELSPVDTSMSW